MIDKKRAAIFANGLLDDPATAKKKIGEHDLIVAADGGAVHCLRLGITPHVLIGDLDSLGAADRSFLEEKGVQIVSYPVDKDYTDLELAIAYTKDSGIQDVLIFGGLGARWDHTLANLLLPLSAQFKDMQLRLLDGSQEVIILDAGEKHELHGQPGDMLSLIPIVDHAHGISTNGLRYPLNGESLYFGSSRGISNVFLRTPVQIGFEEGTLICVITHHE